jgi:hypothetical protein
VSFEAFSGFMVQKTKDTDSQSEILDSFKALANDKDFVTAEDLNRAMDTERVKYLLSVLPPYAGVEGGYDYKKWISTLSMA